LGIMHGLKGTEVRPTPNVEAYTPREIIEAARLSMGEIDLDPASCDLANTVVKAKLFYSENDSGLDRSWAGCVWLNPPFSGGRLRLFVCALLAEFVHCNVDKACLLAPHVGGSTWVDEINAVADYIVCLKQHLPWWGPQRTSGSAIGHSVWLFNADPSPWRDCPLVTAVYKKQWGMYSDI
ncbi:MAG: DNA N-6-adenine-methyltransferase, partial [Gammaproteobacteria bacterium]|nr:DNA N-6-adenine-methyltransferase [Gammaproteobacteria bacterium]